MQGILIKTPVQWPLNKGFSFTCWLRVESFPRGGGTMGLFSFLTESGRGCLGVLGKDKLIYEVIKVVVCFSFTWGLLLCLHFCES